MARCGCGDSNGISVVAGDNVVITGGAGPSNPYVINAHTDCAEARACFSAGNGLNYDSATGAFSADISAAAGNSLTYDGTGLFVSPSTSTITTGAGLLGTGAVGNPARANVDTSWDFPSTADAGGSRVYVDSGGQLRGEPGYHSYYLESEQTSNAVLAVPAGALVNAGAAFSFNVVNPDPYRSVRVILTKEFDARLTLPAGGSAAAGYDGEEVYRMVNPSAGVMAGIHAKSCTTIQAVSSLAPGAATLLSIQPQLGAGLASSTCTQINVAFRVRLLPV